jgi:hypothetical protein
MEAPDVQLLDEVLDEETTLIVEELLRLRAPRD